MKYGRGKWVFGAFLLAARDAARRFTFRHGSAAGGRGSWRPLILQWRRRRKRQVKSPTARVTIPAQVVWFPHFHFHYATHRNERRQGDRVSGLAPATGIAAKGVAVDHHSTSVRANALPLQPHRAYRQLRPFYVSQSSRLKIDAEPKNTAGSSPPGTHSIGPLVARWPLALQFGNAPKPVYAKGKAEERAQPFQSHSRIWHHWLQLLSVRQPTQFGSAPKLVYAKGKAEERAQPFQSHSRVWHHWLQLLRVRQPTLEYHFPHRSPQHNSPRVIFDEPEELVWRRTNRPATEDPNLERHQVTADSFDRPAVRTFQSQELVDHSPMSERAGALQVTKLDPGFLDRLTDDVIRRVEKRARIERQRRGL